MTQQSAIYAGRTKYTEKRSRKYQKRPAEKHKAEMRLLDKAFSLVPKTHRVLDAPCGGGRVTVHLAKRGFHLSAADLSEAMIEIARQNISENDLNCSVELQDVEQLTYPNQSFDTVVCFRLFHHFPTAEIRRRVVKELCRVAALNVVLSYFAPSLSTLKRKLREARLEKVSKKYTTPLAEVEGYFAEAGFRLVKDFAQMPLIHTLHLAVFERSEQTK